MKYAMTNKEALTILIRDKGHCNKSDSVDTIRCSSPCPFNSDQFYCNNRKQIYDRAIKYYLIWFSKEDLVEALI